MNIFVAIGIPHLVKSMQAVHGDPYMRKQLSKIIGVQRCSAGRFENAYTYTWTVTQPSLYHFI